MSEGDGGTIECLSELRRSHARLYEAVSLLNSTFSPALLMTEVFSFFGLVVAFYYTIIGLFGLSDMFLGYVGVYVTVDSLIWSVVSYGRLVFLTTACQRATAEVRGVLHLCQLGWRGHFVHTQ